MRANAAACLSRLASAPPVYGRARSSDTVASTDTKAMQHRWSFFVGVIVSSAMASHRLEAAEPVKPIHTNHTRFRVNFELPASSAKDEPRQVELHVSSDQGVTWQVAGTAKPTERGILFAAPADGEYWFMPRTKYASGKYLPQGAPAAELKVIVDTTPPVVEVEARDEQGEVFIRWRVADRHLKADTFKLEYRQAGTNTAWQRVAVDALENSQTPDDLHGETTFILPIREQATTIVLRAEVTDTAGNRTVKERPLAPQAAGENAAPPAMSSSFAQDPGVASAKPPAPTAYPKTNTPDWPAQESPALVEGARPQQPAPADRAARRELLNASFRSGAERLRELPSAESGNGEVPADLAPPPGVRPHLVNKPSFELLYDVDATGSAGIDQVELWITKNGGGVWTKYGLDEDCRSPVSVTVPGEGLYGFRVVIETTVGLRSPTPVSGDLPDIWVEVDLTKPQVRLVSADQGNGDEADRLVVCWEASDRHLAGRGISLRWSPSPQGPWNTIASGLENSGRYAWRLDQRVPRQIFLLLEARDDAGNVSSNQFAQPVSLDLIRPQGRIRDVRPLGAAPPGGRRL